MNLLAQTSRLLSALVLGWGLLFFADSFAWRGGGWHNVGWNPGWSIRPGVGFYVESGYHNNVSYGYRCKLVPTHWRNGYKILAHRVCWR